MGKIALLVTILLNLWRRGTIPTMAFLYHTHYGVRLLCRATMTHAMRHGKRSWYKVGNLCPACGFIPSSLTIAENQKALDKLLHGVSRHPKQRTA
jgi:ribosomal protein L37E